MKRLILTVVVFFAIVAQPMAQRKANRLIKPVPVVCHASEETEKIYIPPPERFLLKSGNTKKSNINVTYSLFPDDAKAAFEYAVSIWEAIIESEITIEVQANWRSQDENILGSASPAEYINDFKNIPHKGKYYALPVAEKLARADINPYGYPDIVCTFNKDINWYFGTDGQTPLELYDFVTVVLHEIAHGLGFTGFFNATEEIGTYYYYEIGDVAAFDLLVVNNLIQYLVDTTQFAAPSNDLFQALTSGRLYAQSLSAMYSNNNIPPRLYSPSSWDNGSSIYHLNDGTYPPSTGNSLMTHSIAKAEAVHDPGPLATGILDDIGWNYLFINLNEPKDSEELKPIVFNLNIDNGNELDSNSVFLIYNTGDAGQAMDSILMNYIDSSGVFTATIHPESTPVTYNYYISAKDNRNRIFHMPTEAPEELLSVKIGPDLEIPEIVHQPISYFLDTESHIPLKVYVGDNLGLDTVFVEYAINGVTQPPFGLSANSAMLYQGVFPVDTDTLKDGDKIEYRIVAVDASMAKNTISLPVDMPFSFTIERIFEPVTEYLNDFNTSSSDFIQYDFSIYKDSNFDNSSLNSPHPYPSPGKNNMEFNFTTMLKYPVVLNENAEMSFDEVVLVEPGETLANFGDEDFWDYVIVEGSVDTGKTWLPFLDGYDSGAHAVWKEKYNDNIEGQDSKTIGSSDWYVKREINMLQSGNFYAGDTVLIRFRLYSDPFAHGWGWNIDNLRIQTPVKAPVTELSPGNISVFPNPAFNDVFVAIQPDKQVDNIEITVFDIYGQKIFAKHYKSVYAGFSENINFSRYPAGIYLINIYENGVPVHSKKLIKNRAPR
ncbi:MAG: hypothetical protein CSA36_06690 [Draconibacterium sp.]|nr:MAG: hypothetical protein CSA36_06690 [Draconibacterium sp.]